MNRYSWEIPEGGCPEGEDPLAAGKRELAEETGLSAREWRLLGEADLSNSVSDEGAVYFLATELAHGDAEPEGSEVLQHKRVSLEEALQMIHDKSITDALSIIAILHYARLKQPENMFGT
jgi:8-oxo-dGTP pyrophosphatase MutT (NUDIX family)